MRPHGVGGRAQSRQPGHLVESRDEKGDWHGRGWQGRSPPGSKKALRCQTPANRFSISTSKASVAFFWARYYLYYRPDPTAQHVDVLASWHTGREGEPDL